MPEGAASGVARGGPPAAHSIPTPTPAPGVPGGSHPLQRFSFPQLPNFQRALFQQVVGACKPCSDPNLSVAEKGIVPLPRWPSPMCVLI